MKPYFDELDGVHWSIAPLGEGELNLPPISEDEEKEISEHLHPTRKIEYRAIRQLKHLVFGKELIQYGKNGQPILGSKKGHIGISHSKHFGMFAHSMQEFGCDIEEIDDRLIKVAARFTDTDEQNLFSLIPEAEGLTRLWSAKEAVYKLIQQPGIDWKVMRCQRILEDKLYFQISHKNLKIRVHSIKYYNAFVSIAVYENP